MLGRKRIRRKRKPTRFKQQRELVQSAVGYFNLRVMQDLVEGVKEGEYSKDAVRESYGVDLDEFPIVGLVPEGIEGNRRIFGAEVVRLGEEFTGDKIAQYLEEQYREEARLI